MMQNLIRALVVAAGCATATTVGARTVDNEGLNANVGLVVTPVGAVLIAYRNVLADMNARGNAHLETLRSLLGPKADGTTLALPGRLIAREDERLDFGGGVVELVHRGGARTPDDGTDIGEAVKSFDAKPFQRLLSSADLLPGNANRTYLELELE